MFGVSNPSLAPPPQILQAAESLVVAAVFPLNDVHYCVRVVSIRGRDAGAPADGR